MLRTILLFAVLLLSGCASRLEVTYFSDPPGAVLYYGGERKGYTPQTLYYKVSDEDKKRGFLNLKATKAQWASGATAEMKAPRADLSKGLHQKHTFNRPDGIPGRETDVRFSLELERIRAMQRQAAAQEEQAAAQQRQAAAQERATSNFNGTGVTCFKEREWSSGFNKNCVYSCLGSEAVQTMGVTDLCPLTITR